MRERKSQWELSLEEEEFSLQNKQCSKCKRYKLLSDFHRHKGTRLGVTPQCKDCRRSQWRKYRSRADRFWIKYHMYTTKEGDCIVWTGNLNHCGLPRCRYEKKEVSVRRLVYQLALGEVPDDMFVLVTCKNKRCVRHSHLRLGNKMDFDILAANSAATGNRSSARVHPESLRRGEQQSSAKLTEKDIRVIRSLYTEGMSKRSLGFRFGVSRRTIQFILSGKKWSHVQ